MIAPARRLSYRVLLQIGTTDAHSDELLRSPEVDALSAPDRNLATTLVLGTLRWQLALDARIRSLLSRPDAKLSPEAATALRMGAYQLLYLDRIPAHAAIHDSVELVKHSRERGAAGMVNAVLRKLAASEGMADPQYTTGAGAAARAHPQWLVERWVKRYGIEAADAICRWDQEPARVTIRLEDPHREPEGLTTEPGAFLRSARRVTGGDAGRHEALRTGKIRIQEEASQLVAEIAAAAAPEAKRVLDTCAAPGGKTAILAERLPGAAITAVDVSRKRLLAARAMLRLDERVRFEVADAAELRLPPEYELILCDVPCSGTGTMARNPEIRLRIEEKELQRQQARQLAILRASLAALARGGRLVYSTCSLEAEENEAVIAEIQRTTPDMRVISVPEILDRLAEGGTITQSGRERLRTATDGPVLRTIPGLHPCDGFFAAVLERG